MSARRTKGASKDALKLAEAVVKALTAKPDGPCPTLAEWNAYERECEFRRLYVASILSRLDIYGLDSTLAVLDDIEAEIDARVAR